ncbi:MAG TPA: type III-B CRISPR module-associated protein Cmr5 [Bryobacterales bacterium]|jgi:CRISPR-associated protein Cmr5|nr:type III-B CRISPR module-associated protein Cmr5 [Bryobacterales bacterium]
MALKTLAQQRAQHAWDVVQQALKRPDFEKRFADPAKKMPARVRSSGLGQTVAFMRAKGGGDVLKAVAGWCHQSGLIQESGEEGLLVQFKDGTAADLRQLTAEALAYLEWLVRFADAARKDK